MYMSLVVQRNHTVTLEPATVRYYPMPDPDKLNVTDDSLPRVS